MIRVKAKLAIWKSNEAISMVTPDENIEWCGQLVVTFPEPQVHRIMGRNPKEVELLAMEMVEKIEYKFNIDVVKNTDYVMHLKWCPGGLTGRYDVLYRGNCWECDEK